jgi:hypothetical protein
MDRKKVLERLSEKFAFLETNGFVLSKKVTRIGQSTGFVLERRIDWRLDWIQLHARGAGQNDLWLGGFVYVQTPKSCILAAACPEPFLQKKEFSIPWIFFPYRRQWVEEIGVEFNRMVKWFDYFETKSDCLISSQDPELSGGIRHNFESPAFLEMKEFLST